MDSLAGVWNDLLSSDAKLQQPKRDEAPHTREEMTAARQWVKDFGIDIESLEMTGCRMQDAHTSLNIEHETLRGDVSNLDKALSHITTIRKSVKALAETHLGPPDFSDKMRPQLAAMWTEIEASKSALKERLRSVEANIAMINALMARLRETSGLTCTICMVHDISTAIIPCGHTCCRACAERLSNGTCFMCRAPFHGVQSIRV